MLLRSVLAGGAVLLVGCAQDPFFLEARAVEVCQHLPAQRFSVPPGYSALPAGMQLGLELERTFDFEVTAQLPPETAEMLESQFALTSVRLTVVNPEDHLGFVDSARLQLQPENGSGLEPRVFTYVRKEEAPRAVGWAGEAFDVAKYLESGTLKYTVSLLGSLPPGDVLVDVDACAEVKVKIDYL